MNAIRASNILLLVCAALFSCAVHGQDMHTRELEAYRLDLREQVSSGKLTAQEAASLYSRKQDQIKAQAGAEKARAGEPPREPAGRGTDVPGLICQTYPDGRTECR